MGKHHLIITIIIGLFVAGCASYSTQYDMNNVELFKEQKNELDKIFYLIGDAGYTKNEELPKGVSLLKKMLDTTTMMASDQYVLFLGDNIYPKGMPSKESKERKLAEKNIENQIQGIQNFKGKTIFIPGNHDWYTDGIEGLKRQEDFIKKKLKDKNSFLPKNGCPIESITVSDKVQLLIIDSQWYLSDWNKHPRINDDCEFKTKESFFLEIEGEFKKNNNKTVIVALHHPMVTYGPHGGKFNANRHIFPMKAKVPMPLLGTLTAQIRSQGGVSVQDVSNEHYKSLIRRLSTMSRSNEKVIFVSGHEHSLQYINKEGLHQIISGSGAKKSPVNLGQYGVFAHPDFGFATLKMFKDGSSEVSFYGEKDEKLTRIFTKRIFDSDQRITKTYPDQFPQIITASAYPKVKTEKSKSYAKFWGEHYRYVYGTSLNVKVATLDTLLGGLTIDRKGGGQQTRSLRLLDKQGRRYSMRAVQKSATQFLQKAAFKNTYLEDSFDETFTEDLLLDFYTSSHPYATFAVGPMADAISVYHTNPQLVFIPKHAAMGRYNEDFGDELYILEERPGKEFSDVVSFGKPDDIESTPDMIKKLRKSEKYTVDEKAYIRARLFDMILGDWDRHPDQWRWARFDNDDKHLYRPIPRDRDQVFSKYDGTLIDAVKFLIPLTRKFQEYDEELKNIRWINESGIRLDRALTPKANKEIWTEEALYIKNHLSDKIIDEAFKELPKEIQDDTLEVIKKNLKKRRDLIEDIASRYYNYLAKHIVIRGTDKEDKFEIIREKNTTVVRVYRLKKGKKKDLYFERKIKAAETKEIWIYGLDDDDHFEVKGKGSKYIKIRIIGGHDGDEFKIENRRKIKIYDHKRAENKILEKSGATKIFSNTYEYNVYDYNRYINKTNTITPFIGFNPDDGFNVNITNAYTVKGFKNSPFQSRHKIRAAYYFATQGFDFSYTSDFSQALGNWDLQIGGIYTSHNFTENFFGFGNSTINEDDEKGLDYNRVKTSIISGSIGLTNFKFNGSRIALKTMIEGIEIDETANRFLTSDLVFRNQVDEDFFERQYFGGIELTYGYESYDNKANPSRGMNFKVKTASKMNLEDTRQAYGYLNPHLGFHNALTRNKKLVLKTDVDAQILIGDDYEFYQAARLGGDNGLRGYREQRFAGRSAVVFNADLRYSFQKFKTGVLPLQFGIYGGYDYGRVWLDDEDSDTWHDSVGGGFWINAVDAVSGQLGVFNSDEGTRVSFGIGVDF